MAPELSRVFNFESVPNFRDLGGISTKEGRRVARGRVFRSGDPYKISEMDFKTIKNEIRIKSVIDLRTITEVERKGKGLQLESEANYHWISFGPNVGVPNTDIFKRLNNWGERYLQIAEDSYFSRGIIEALTLISEPGNFPILFHCTAGKDRTGLLAAFILSILNVGKEDIVSDYCLSNPLPSVFLVKGMPDWYYQNDPKAMRILLDGLDSKYGSIRNYLSAKGAEPSLFNRLEKSLLV